MEDDYKEVYFNKYCKSCKFKNNKEIDEPCEECLANPMNVNSHKPVNYKKNELIKKKGNTGID